MRKMERSSGPVFGYEIEGTLTREESRRYAREMEAAIARYGTIRVLARLKGMPDMTAGALWDDLRFAFKHIGDFDRMAVVGDTRWASLAEKIASLVPGLTARHFRSSELDAAWRWLEEPMPGPALRDPDERSSRFRPGTA